MQDQGPSPQDRRNSPRVPIDVPFFIRMRIDGEGEITGLLIDCSLGGVQLALSMPSGVPAVWMGAEVGIADMPGIDAVLAGSITWISSDRCGVRFHQALAMTEEELRDLLDVI